MEKVSAVCRERVVFSDKSTTKKKAIRCRHSQATNLEPSQTLFSSKQRSNRKDVGGIVYDDQATNPLPGMESPSEGISDGEGGRSPGSITSYPHLKAFLLKLRKSSPKSQTGQNVIEMKQAPNLDHDNSEEISNSGSRSPEPLSPDIVGRVDSKNESYDEESPANSCSKQPSPLTWRPSWAELDAANSHIKTSLDRGGMTYLENKSSCLQREMERLEVFLIIVDSITNSY